ncbi:3-methyl-2-oxobutanoate hydroxymethyltransferase [bacterium]|nr:3-methyl-2-oxobutanoate hydroxymethyltransferase [bacterium]
MEPKKITAPYLAEMKRKGVPIAALTAYDATLAAVEDKAGLDVILVGDSSGMVITGLPDTISITLDEIVFLTKNVSRGVKRALLVADLPFGVAQVSTEACIEGCIRLMKEGRAEAVKVEGAGHTLEAISRMTEMGMPVMGHLGLTPQSVHVFGGYALRGAEEKEAQRIREDALKLQDAGVFAIVLEKIPVELAKVVSESLTIPTIGIGSGSHCDGQILVSYDMLGLGPKFRFVRRYLEGSKLIGESVRQYIDDIRNRDFPNDDESYFA